MVMMMVLLLMGMVIISAPHFDPWRRAAKFMFLRMLGFRIHRKKNESYPCLRRAEHELKEFVGTPFLKN